jgi:tetratricopeptide (TPR) repeat protein
VTVDRRLALARHYLDVDQPERALEHVEGLLAESPEDGDLWELRAEALFDLGDYEEATEAARSGLARAPDSVVLLDMLALAEAKRGDFAEAERAVLAALRLAPDHPTLLAHYALFLAQVGQTAKADRVLERAERSDPEDEAVRTAQIQLAYLSGDDRRVERESRRLLEDVPDHPVGHAFLGGTAAERGSFARAARHLDIAARHDLSDPEFAELAREARIVGHPLLVPLWPFERLGPGKVWIGAIGTMLLLQAAGLEPVALVFAAAYVLLCVYSWVVPPLLRRWARSRW